MLTSTTVSNMTYIHSTLKLELINCIHNNREGKERKGKKKYIHANYIYILDRLEDLELISKHVLA